jgi:hypothetical protein
MQSFKLLILLLVASCTSALVSPSSGRRAFLTKAPAAAAAIAVATAVPAFANAEEEYKFYVAPPVKEKKTNNTGSLAVGGVLFGGFALSLPFFLPNLMRMAGVKNAKTPTATETKKGKKKR